MKTVTPTPLIVVYPRGQLTPDDKQRMSEHGILCVEADDPKSVVTLIPSAPFFSPDDLMMAALKAVATGEAGERKHIFAAELFNRFLARETGAAQ